MSVAGQENAIAAPPAGVGKPTAAPRLDEIREPDLHEVAGFIHREATGSAPSTELHASLTARMRWLLIDNPARQADVAWGWLLRDGDQRIVGAMLNIPQRFMHQGKTFVAMMSAKWFVNEAHRGGGVGIFMRYVLLGKRFALFATTAAPQSAALWKKFGGYEIPDQDQEMLGVVRAGPLVEEAIFRRAGKPALARAAGALALIVPQGLRAARGLGARGELTSLASAAEVAKLGLPEATDELTAVRDEPFIAWRHFKSPDAQSGARGVFAFRVGSGPPSLVVTHIEPRGHRQQIRSLQVLDVWGPLADSDMPSLAGALARRFAGRVDTIVFRGQPARRRDALMGTGFKHRAFAAPVGWCIDKHGLLPTKNWYLVQADAE